MGATLPTQEMEVSWVKGVVKEWEQPGLGVIRREYPDQGGVGFGIKESSGSAGRRFSRYPRYQVTDPRDPKATVPIDL